MISCGSDHWPASRVVNSGDDLYYTIVYIWEGSNDDKCPLFEGGQAGYGNNWL